MFTFLFLIFLVTADYRRRQRLIDLRPDRSIRQFPAGRVDRLRHLLHRVEIDLVDGIGNLMIIRVTAVHIKDDRHAAASVVEMVRLRSQSPWRDDC